MATKKRSTRTTNRTNTNGYFRKTFTIFSWLKINVSKTGISITIGKKGWTLNIGKNGVTGNATIPGTGIRVNKKLVDGKTVEEGLDSIKNRKKKSDSFCDLPDDETGEAQTTDEQTDDNSQK